MGLSLSFQSLAQDKTAELFRHDNPNLINLNEPTEYTGQPLVYIEGIKAPEKANNDMEALQLKFFGTKDIESATKDTLQLDSNTLPQESENQVQNYTFKTPFHKTTQAAFIHHIPYFLTIIHVLNQKELVVEENLTVMNTDENFVWTRTIPLPAPTNARITKYVQNGQSFSVRDIPQTGNLNFESSQPLKLGPNQIALTYQMENPLISDQLDLDITGTNLAWPIETFKTLVLFSVPEVLQTGKLTFGTNYLDIPDIYTQRTDNHSNVYFQINRIVPPNANIHMQMQLNLSKLPVSISDWTTQIIFGLGMILLICYWFAFAWWNKHFFKPNPPSKIKQPKSFMLFSKQMGIPLTSSDFQTLSDFYTANNIPTDALNQQKLRWEKHPKLEAFKTNLYNFLLLTYEVIIGTVLLVGLILYTLAYLKALTTSVVFLTLLFSFIGLVLLYFLALKS